jgi:hypothetical protein
MARSVAVLAVLALFGATVCFGQAGSSDKKLIQVKPDYSEPVAYPQPEPQLDPYAPIQPRPRDQLYVFWILGRVISYPIDKVEAYLTNMKFDRKKDGSPVPASAGPEANPFNAVNWREIPPAPPVSK